MAGRYQGYHCFRNKDGERYFEIFWQQTGWFWQLRSPRSAPESEAIGPFTTSTEAYQSARSGRWLTGTPEQVSATRRQFTSSGG
jgi:hypothetical protein